MSTYAHSQLLEKEIDILQTGQWWIVELDEPNIAVQAESEEEALDKLAKRLEQYQNRRNRDSGWANRSRGRGTRAQDIDQSVTTQ